MTNDKLTRHQKSTLRVSIVTGALSLIAVSVSVLSYLKADSTMQAFYHRGRLEVVGLKPRIQITSPQNGAVFLAGQSVTITAQAMAPAEVEVLNVGDLPAKDVKLTLQYDKSVTSLTLPKVSPTMPMESTQQDTATFITLKMPIAPRDKIKIQFPTIPETVWVTSDTGERSTISFPSISKIEFYQNGKLVGQSKVDSNGNASQSLPK